jgi:hypothetical protein
MSVSHIKSAVIAAATVIAVIYIARQIPVVGTYVDKAISG